MKKKRNSKILIYVMYFIYGAIFIGGIGILLSDWDIPTPTEKIERVLPDERFPR